MQFGKVVSSWVLLLGLGSGCVWGGGGFGATSPMEVAALRPGTRVEVTSLEVTPPKRVDEVAVSGDVDRVSGDTLYLAEGQALPRSTIVSVRPLSKGTSFFHDVAMGALAGLAMHVAINGLSLGMH